MIAGFDWDVSSIDLLEDDLVMFQLLELQGLNRLGDIEN